MNLDCRYQLPPYVTPQQGSVFGLLRILLVPCAYLVRKMGTFCEESANQVLIR